MYGEIEGQDIERCYKLGTEFIRCLIYASIVFLVVLCVCISKESCSFFSFNEYILRTFSNFREKSKIQFKPVKNIFGKSAGVFQTFLTKVRNSRKPNCQTLLFLLNSRQWRQWIVCVCT